MMDEIIQIITETETATEEALVEALQKAEKDEGTIQAALAVSRTLAAFRDSLSEEDLAEIAKSLKFEVEQETEEETEKAEEEAETETEEVEAEKAEEEESEESEEVSKSDTEEDAEIASLQTRIAELESDKRRNQLAREVAGLRVGKTEAELVDVLKAVEDAGGDVEPVLETFRAADAMFHMGLGEIGSDMPGVYAGDTYDKLEARAREIQRQSDEPIDFAHALKRAGEENPDLIKQYYED